MLTLDRANPAVVRERRVNAFELKLGAAWKASCHTAIAVTLRWPARAQSATDLQASGRLAGVPLPPTARTCFAGYWAGQRSNLEDDAAVLSMLRR